MENSYNSVPLKNFVIYTGHPQMLSKFKK